MKEKRNRKMKDSERIERAKEKIIKKIKKEKKREGMRKEKTE